MDDTTPEENFQTDNAAAIELQYDSTSSSGKEVGVHSGIRN
jgi:hypothetical protein